MGLWSLPVRLRPLGRRLYSHHLSCDIYYTYTASSCSCIQGRGLTHWIMTLSWEPQSSTMHLAISNPIHISFNYGISTYLTGSPVAEMGVNVTLMALLLPPVPPPMLIWFPTNVAPTKIMYHMISQTNWLFMHYCNIMWAITTKLTNDG